MKSTCWDTRATDSITEGGQMDTKASIIRSVLIFNHISVNGIMMKSFFEVS